MIYVLSSDKIFEQRYTETIALIPARSVRLKTESVSGCSYRFAVTMSSSIAIRLAFLSFLAIVVRADRDLGLCDIERMNYGLIPPALPRNFEIKGESMNFDEKVLQWHELYFDSDALLGKLVSLFNGIEIHSAVNYEVEQVVRYYKLHPGVRMGRDPMSELCEAEDIEGSDVENVFGYRESNRDIKRSRMFDSSEAMRFGGPHPYSHQGYEYLDGRGLNASVFRGCVYDVDDDETSLVYYYFSGSNTVPAGGTPESVVDGVTKQPGPLSVPLSRFGVSSTTRRTADGKIETVTTNFTDNFSWFKGEPNFKMDTFRIPDWMYCKDYRGSKGIPEIPQGFSVRYEMTSFTQGMEGDILTATILLNHQVFYDYEKKIARLDYKPLEGKDTEINALFQSYEPVKVVFDYNVGIKYVIHKPTGRCFAKPIDLGDMFDSSRQGLVLKMGTPEEVLGMNADEMEYKGTSVVRDITTDVYIGKYFDEEINTTVFKESYFATDGWHEETLEELEYFVPVRLATFTNRMEDGLLQQTVTEKNFFKFKGKTPDLMMFDIKGCIDHVEHKFFAIVLSVAQSDQEKVLRFRWNFQQAAQYFLSQISEIGTVLRVQRVVLHKSGDSLVITFAMLGKIDLKTQVPYGQKGLSVDDAVDVLIKKINSGRFSFKFTTPAEDDFAEPDVTEIFALPNSLHKYDPSKKKYFGVVSDSRKAPVQDSSSPNEPVYYDDNKPVPEDKPKAKKGMPPGGLAALSITMLILGVGIGIGIMYFYLKKYGASGRPDQYAMQNK